MVFLGVSGLLHIVGTGDMSMSQGTGCMRYLRIDRLSVVELQVPKWSTNKERAPMHLFL